MTLTLTQQELTNVILGYLLADGRLENVKSTDVTFNHQDITASVAIVRKK